jgi:hypothetical protein
MDILWTHLQFNRELTWGAGDIINLTMHPQRYVGLVSECAPIETFTDSRTPAISFETIETIIGRECLV